MLSPLSDPRPTPPAPSPSSSAPLPPHPPPSAPLPPHPPPSAPLCPNPPPFTAVSAAVAAAAAEAMANSTPTSPLPHPQDLFLGGDSLKTPPPKDVPPVGPPVGPPTPRSPQPRQNQVGTVLLHGEYIVSLMIDGRERLCLAQISNTLLKDFSYNEIHNRRVALGITCVQCTPVQLEILRRAGAMPISSRRCGMITKREAERLVKSFLEDTEPPKLPESFAFNVIHACGWGCSGQFLPARYNSSRAKCIKCDHCAMFFSPNKFIFHFHRLPDAKYHHPDAANFNSWRRHLRLNYDNPSEELVHVWEDVKAMFNGGSRKRLVTSGPGSGHGGGSGSKSGSGGSGRSSGGGEHGKRPRMQGVVEAGSTAMMGKMAAGLPYPYPVMPLSAANNACSNMAAAAAAGAYMSRAPHPAFPFPAPADPSVFPTAAIDATKAAQNNMADFWKTKTATAAPYVHPFNYFWAKNLALYNDNTAPYRNVLDFSRQAAGKPLPVDPVSGKTSHPTTPHPHPHPHHPRLSPPAPSPPSPTPAPRDPAAPHPDVDKYFSAFKPVARDNNNKMAAGPFDDPLPLPAEDRASCWLSPDARSSDNSDMSAMGDDVDSVTGQDADDADVINVTDVEHAESRDAPDDVTGDQQSAGNGLSVGQEVHDAPLTSRRVDDVTENDAGSCSPLRLTKSDKQNTEEGGEAEAEPVVHRPWADSDRIYNMSREELQSELRRMMEERRRAEVDYLGLSATYEDKVKRHGDLREGIDRPLHLVKDAVQCPEVEEERQAQQLMHDKLKEAREALQQFSHKMMALRGCIDCT